MPSNDVRGSVGSRTKALLALLTVALVACSSDSGHDAQPQSAPPASPPSALFVLGDSLSDVGNAAAARDYLLSGEIDPPTVGLCNPTDVLVAMRRCDDLFFEKSRVTDGPVAVEHLAASLGLAPLRPSLHLLPNRARDATSYAVASAKARGAGEEDLARQVDWLLLDHTPLPSDAVYVVMIGGNDALEALRADAARPAGGTLPSTAIVTATVESIGMHVERLLAFGARRLVVANVPDLAMLPAVRQQARASNAETRVLATASAISDSFNRSLAERLDRIEARALSLTPTPVIARYDLHAALSGARQTLSASGANAVDACFDSELYRDSSTAQRVFHADCAPEAVDDEPRFDGFVFFDEIHPTGAAHALLGDALLIAVAGP
jgi:phospholipase/lecithinase/hemolysin